MVFGLFKKNEIADVIFKSGQIYTLNPDAPKARGMACKDGKIIAIGDDKSLEELRGKHTETVDLSGRTVLPGFIDVCGHPVLQAFENVCLILYDDMTKEQMFEALSGYIKANPDKHAYFAYGFDTTLLIDKSQKELLTMLDKVCSDKPVVLLDISGAEGWFNTKALEMVKESMDQEDPPIITLPYILHVLSPIDFEQLQGAILEIIAESCQKGYTMIFDCGAPDYLHSIYQEIVIELFQMEMRKQRFRGSHFVMRNITPEYAVRRFVQKSTACSETDKHVSCDVLKLILSDARNADPEGKKISLELFKILAKEATDRGFNLHVDAIEKTDVADAFEAAFTAKSAGSKKSHFTIAHDNEFTEEERMELFVENDICETGSTLGDFRRKYVSADKAEDTAKAIDALTIDAAAQLGINDEFGSLEVGKYADFAIFDDDPFASNIKEFRKVNVWMTIIAGKVAYNSQEDSAQSWKEILKSKQDELNDQMLEEYDDDEILT